MCLYVGVCVYMAGSRHIRGYALRGQPIDVLVGGRLAAIGAASRIDGAEAERATAIGELALQHDQRERPHGQIDDGKDDGHEIIVRREPADDADQVQQNGGGVHNECLLLFVQCTIRISNMLC